MCSRLQAEEPAYMDLNYLYHRQQVSLMRADAAACDAAAHAHRGLAELYGSLIERRRSDRDPGGKSFAASGHNPCPAG